MMIMMMMIDMTSRPSLARKLQGKQKKKKSHTNTIAGSKPLMNAFYLCSVLFFLFVSSSDGKEETERS